MDVIARDIEKDSLEDIAPWLIANNQSEGTQPIADPQSLSYIRTGNT